MSGPNGAARPEVGRVDGLVDAITGVGAGKGATANIAITASRVLTMGELEALYTSNPFARKAVAMLPEEATRRGVRVMVQEAAPEDAEPFREEVDALLPHAEEAVEWARLYGGGWVIPLINDGRDMALPITGEIRSVDGFLVGDRYELTVAEYQTGRDSDQLEGAESSILGPIPIGQPVQYNYTPHVDQIHSGQIVHADRVLRWDGVRMPPRLRYLNDGWGLSVINAAWEVLADYGMVRRASAHLIQEFSLVVLEVEDLLGIVSRGQTDLLTKRLLALNLGKSIAGVILADKGREEVKILDRRLAGLADVRRGFMSDMAAALDMPLTKLFGHAPQGLGTDDRSGERNWAARVESLQSESLTPQVERFVTMLKHVRGAAVGPDAATMLKWPPVQPPTGEEEALLRARVSEVDERYLKTGVLSAEEVRQSRFGGVDYSTETQLDASLDEVLATPFQEPPEEALAALGVVGEPEGEPEDLEATEEAPEPPEEGEA